MGQNLLKVSVLSIAVGIANVFQIISLDLHSYTVLIAEKNTGSTRLEFKINGDLKLSNPPLSPKVYIEDVSSANAER